MKGGITVPLGGDFEYSIDMPYAGAKTVYFWVLFFLNFFCLGQEGCGIVTESFSIPWK